MAESVTDADGSVRISREDVAAAQLAARLWRDPEGRDMLMRQTKRLYPDTPMPELDARDLVASLRGEDAKLKTTREALDKRLNAMALQDARAQAIAEHGLSLADVPEIEKLMEERLIADHTTAAEIIANRRELASVAAPRSGPTTYRVPGVHTPDDQFYMTSPSGFGILNHPRGPHGWASSRAGEMLAEMKKGTR